MADNAQLRDNVFEDLSSAAVAIGAYWSPFAESPRGSNVTLQGNRIRNCSLGHRTAGGGGWGAGSAIRVEGTSNVPLNVTIVEHLGVHLVDNVVNTSGDAAVQARSVRGLTIERNRFCVDGGADPMVIEACSRVAEDGNVCCVQGGGGAANVVPC